MDFHVVRPRLWNHLALFFAAFVILNLTACPGPSPKSHEKTDATQQTIFVKGDPMALVAGARFNPNSPITEADAPRWSHMLLSQLVQFVEKEEVIKEDHRSLEAQNAPKDRTGKRTFPVRISSGGDGRWTLEPVGLGFQLELTRTPEGRLQPTRVLARGRSMPITPLHWSVSRDRKFVSFLSSYQDEEDGRALLAFYFEVQPAQAEHIPTTIEKYNYVAGPGKKIGWKVPPGHELEIQLCGSPQYQAYAQEAVEVWKPSLRGRLPIKFSMTNDYAPFSDLNQHCIYVVDAYTNNQRSDVFNYGTTYTILSGPYARYIDADIFIYKAEAEKVRAYVASKRADPSMADAALTKDLPIAFNHEMGHLLGLDHQFDGTPSVMSYEFKYREPQPYDTAALEELYPLRAPTILSAQ